MKTFTKTNERKLSNMGEIDQVKFYFLGFCFLTINFFPEEEQEPEYNPRDYELEQMTGFNEWTRNQPFLNNEQFDEFQNQQYANQ